MQIDRFKDSPIGSLAKIQVEEGGQTVEHYAFVPNDLPPEIPLGPKAMDAVLRATHQLGRLDGIARELLPNPTLLSRPTIRREAVSTSALEGTYAPADEVLSSEVDEDRPRSSAVTEILNFVHATELGLARLAELPICLRLIKELQGELIRGTPSEDWQAGEVRSTQVIIGPYKGCSVKEAYFVPPPPGPTLEHGLAAWEQWINDESSLVPVLVRVAVGHYQFESLHPFTDGNGRIGRLVAILQLISNGLIGEPLINLSPYFEARSDQYRHLLREVSATGRWEEWIEFFCEGVIAQASDAEQRIRDLLSWRDDTVGRLKAAGVKGVALDIVARLIEFPVISVRSVREHHNVSNQAANGAVARLESFDVLRELTGKAYNRVFDCPEVMGIFFRPSQQL